MLPPLCFLVDYILYPHLPLYREFSYVLTEYTLFLNSINTSPWAVLVSFKVLRRVRVRRQTYHLLIALYKKFRRFSITLSPFLPAREL